MTLIWLSAAVVAGCGQGSETASREATAAAQESAVTAPEASPPHTADAAGPAPVHRSDELAAHPDDPDRMARGVALEEIIPRPALMAAEEAVAEYPDEPRFHYQLGRALAASGHPQEALSAYETAAEMGYRMAYYNIGISYANGDGVAADAIRARENLQKAADLGVSVAQDWLSRYVFSPEGFSNAAFFQAIYEGNFNDINADPTDMATYLTTFVEPFTETDGCGMVISRASYTKMAQHAQMAVLGKMLGTMASSSNDHASGDFAGAAAAGYRAGERFNVDIAAMIDKGHDDAQIFYDRYGCDSATAQTFFANVETYGNNLGSASFTRELERNYQR